MSSSTSLTHLNNDCLQHVFKFLQTTVDKLVFSYVCINFRNYSEINYVLAFSIKDDTFSMAECKKFLSLNEARSVLKHFGSHIKRLNMLGTIDKEELSLYRLIPNYCREIQAIELHFSISKWDCEVCEAILSTSKNLQSVRIKSTTCTEHSSQLLSIVSNCESIQHLHLSGLKSIDGECLCKLKNLVELDISCCKLFGNENLMKIFQSNRLKSINIAYCPLLENDSIQTLADTQSQLEHLTISTTIRANNFQCLKQLVNLKEFIVYDYKGYKLTGVVESITKHSKLEVLKIINDFPYYGAWEILAEHILSLKNLKVLYFPDDEDLDDNVLLTISLKLLNLEKLRIRIEADCLVTDNGLVEITKNSYRLRELIVYTTSKDFESDLLFQIVHVKRESNRNPLQIYWSEENIAEDVLDSAEYLDNLDILQIRPVCNWNDLDKFLVWDDCYW